MGVLSSAAWVWCCRVEFYIANTVGVGPVVDGRQQAMDYMQGYLSTSSDMIAAEVDRYIGTPGQALAYKLGELKIRELRQRAKESLGEKFILRDFHDCVLGTGLVSLPILEAQVQSWINKTKERSR